MKASGSELRLTVEFHEPVAGKLARIARAWGKTPEQVVRIVVGDALFAPAAPRGREKPLPLRQVPGP